jgi:hypothetical protein
MDSNENSTAQRAIDSRSAFVNAVHEAVDLALARRARRMLWADSDFADWPLDDPALLQRLTDWLRLPQRQLVLLASDYEDLRRRRARFVACFRLWSHVISAHSPAEDDVAQLPCLLLADRTVLVQLLDKSHWRGWTSIEPTSLRAWQEHTDAVLQRSESTFAVTTLGL